MLATEQAGIRYESDAEQEVVACEGVTFAVADGEFAVLVGRSGCGKTSLLYAIDGLLPLTSGRILLNGQDVREPGHDRAMVFQSPTLFPWRDVVGNIIIGSEVLHGRTRAERNALDLVRLVGLSGFEHHHPHQLSGGMQQRVNLARALAVDPDVLLLDEPFSALDAQTRELMQAELLRVWRTRNAGERHLTTVFVTHDIAEAVYLADRVIVFTPRPGRVREEIEVQLERPRDTAVKRTPAFQEYVEQISTLLEEPEE